MREVDAWVRELDCLHAVSRLVQPPDISIEEICQGVVDLIPAGLQFPEITCARIVLEHQEFRTGNFEKTEWRLSADIILERSKSAILEVYYLEERSESDCGPFLKQEAGLVRVVAQRLVEIVRLKRLEIAVGEERKKTSFLMDNLPGFVYIQAPDYSIPYCNDLFRKIFGESEKKVCYELFWGQNEPCRVCPTLETLAVGRFDTREWVSPDGRIYQVYDYPICDNQGSPVVLKVGLDFTDWKLAERKRRRAEHERLKIERSFRELVENSLTGIFIIQDDEIVFKNSEQERLFGPLTRFFNTLNFENIHPDDEEKVKNNYQKILFRKIQSLDMDFRFYPFCDKESLGKSDSRQDMRWVYCRTSWIEYQGKEAILVNMVDITRVKELEQLLRIQDKMTSLGRVAAGIAHEIRNPLSGININLNTLKKIIERMDYMEGEGFGNVKEIFHQITSASNKIESVIKRVMDFSRPSEPRYILTSINLPIEEAINLSAVTMRKSGIAIEKALADNLLPCHIDPRLIEQVVINLITNAAEAMENVGGPKKIRIASSMEDGLILVKVFDSGPGVPLNNRTKIFDPFFTTKHNGTGIGLSVCHRIIADHDGSVRVHTSEWGGAEFVIEIPMLRAHYDLKS